MRDGNVGRSEYRRSQGQHGFRNIPIRWIPAVLVVTGVLLLAACVGGGGYGPAGPAIARPASEPVPTDPSIARPASEPVSPFSDPQPPRPSFQHAETPPITSPANPAYHLRTRRFRTYQPQVLEQIGAHHAYARNLGGWGVRIGIEDSVVDYTQTAEFGHRVRLSALDGAVLSYRHPFGDESLSDVQACLRRGTCKAWRLNSDGIVGVINLWVQREVKEDGWPRRDDSLFLRDDHYSRTNAVTALFRWWEVPTPYGRAGSHGTHGTIVASVAAGANLGVAPGATIIPIAKNLTDDQVDNAFASEALRLAFSLLPSSTRRTVDDLWSKEIRENYAKFDIINRSYGTALFDPNVVSSQIASELRWFRRYFPKTLKADLQSDTPASRRTILVYAAGNEGQRWSGLGADLPFYIPELRGHSLAVVATDPRTGRIASYSNRCGPLPRNWNAARHGRHYCLAAPGTVRGLVPYSIRPGRGRVWRGLAGTSYAAPVVSGALALLKQHFRSTKGNTEIVKRMIDTADRSGRYADLNTYGAGFLDLEAALSPVGTLNAGQSARALSNTALQTPVAFGSLGQRLGGIQLAAFDDQDFPFWVPLSGLVSRRTDGRSPVPELFREGESAPPAMGLDVLGMRWAALEGAGGRPFLEQRGWLLGIGPTSTSLARVSRGGAWGYGFNFENAGNLGSRTSGAFGSDPHSGMVWTSRAFESQLGGGWRLNAKGTLAVSVPQYENNAIFSASPSVMSALSMRIGTGSTGFTVEQPLRAESGTGTFRVENGRMENGRRLYDEYRVPLRPNVREIRMVLRHARAALGGNFALEVGHSLNAGHVAGEHDSSVGFAYRMTW